MKGPLAKTVVLLVGMYVFLKFILPLFTAPLPASLIFLYLALTLASAMIFYTMSGGSLDEFMGPIGRFLTGTGQTGIAGTARILVFVLFPLLVGWQTYTRLAPSDLPPAENRTIHPAPPGEFVGLANPYPRTPENIMMGKGLYAAFCSPCHGANFDGKARRRSASIRLRRTSAIPEPSPSCRNPICSGGSKREASGCRSKRCPGNRPCRDGKWNCRTNGSGKSSWANMTAPANLHGPGRKRNKRPTPTNRWTGIGSKEQENGI